MAELVACLEAETRKVSVEEKKERRERERENKNSVHPDLNTSFLSLSLCPTQHQTIPCSFLYDGPGSALYDAITDLEAYYPYDAELELLNSQSDAIAAAIPENAVLVELGCGSATKTPRLLSAVARRKKSKSGGPVQVRGDRRLGRLSGKRQSQRDGGGRRLGLGRRDLLPPLPRRGRGGEGRAQGGGPVLPLAGVECGEPGLGQRRRVRARAVRGRGGSGLAAGAAAKDGNDGGRAKREARRSSCSAPTSGRTRRACARPTTTTGG